MEAGEILLNSGLLDERELKLSRDSQRNGGSVLQSAIDLGFVSEEKALQELHAAGVEHLLFMHIFNDDLIAAAKEAVAEWLEGKQIVKEIVVPGRMVNFVAK